MSAIHITAEVGRVYLLSTGLRVRVTDLTARRVTYMHEEGFPMTSRRSVFEHEIESVLS